ncbi:MAG: nuclear transport factor 2 family protein [Phycisphaeraceae bacterium]|nr:nuclear transport factor 2 family protein [Phycisphaeraceae bacterium]MCB9848835.1 nuclear transport factor 2 family protein [Phycisphaeraceae bacterium]
MPDGHDEIVTRFASALDTEDYDRALACLAPGCVYEIRGDTHRGPEAIVASYKGNGDAAQSFDAIAYGSEVRPGEDGWVVIAFWDRITHAGETLLHRCEQWCRVGAGGLIERIEHRDFPGERERLEAFKRRHGF